MKRAARQRGFALLVVLWTLGFLSLLGTALVAAGRQETQRSRNLLDSALAEARADGAVQQAIYALLDPSPARWRPDGSRHVLRSGHYRIEVRLDDENGKINPNFAPVEMLQALLAQLGVPNQDATKLAAAIDRWRTPGGQTVQVASTQPLALPSGAPFETLDELGLLPGMPQDLLVGLKPHMSLFSNYDPDATTRDPVVAAAIGPLVRNMPTQIADAPAQVVMVHVVVHGPGGTGFSEDAVVRTNALDGIRRHEILSREVVPMPPAPTQQDLSDGSTVLSVTARR